MEERQRWAEGSTNKKPESSVKNYYSGMVAPAGDLSNFDMDDVLAVDAFIERYRDYFNNCVSFKNRSS